MAPSPRGWAGFALSEWELEGAGSSDHHPHDEVNYVIEGELHVKVEDTTVVGRPGDTIRVPVGSTGEYWAPKYARMLAIYGANPEAQESDYIAYWDVESSGRIDLASRGGAMAGQDA